MANREAVYIISVAARLVEMHPSTLRKYERVGFLEPSRLGGKLRLYSVEDIERLRQIKYLVEARGVNLAGIELALELTDGLRQLRESLKSQASPARGPGRTEGQSSGSDGKEIQRLRLLVERMLQLLGADTDTADDAARVAGGLF